MLIDALFIALLPCIVLGEGGGRWVDVEKWSAFFPFRLLLLIFRSRQFLLAKIRLRFTTSWRRLKRKPNSELLSQIESTMIYVPLLFFPPSRFRAFILFFSGLRSSSCNSHPMFSFDNKRDFLLLDHSAAAAQLNKSINSMDLLSSPCPVGHFWRVY